MKPFCSTRVHSQGNASARFCLLRLQQCSTTFSQAINLNVELHSTGCLSQPFFWCYLQSKRSKTLSVVRGSPRLLAYQPVIYVKILAKRESEGKKKGKASKKASWQSSDTRKRHSKIHVPHLPGFTTLEMGLVSLPLCFLTVLGCSLKPAASPSPPSATKLHLARCSEGQRMHASSTSLMRKASPALHCANTQALWDGGETTQDQGSARHWISTSATGSWAILNESQKNKPFTSAFLLVKHG